MLKNVCVILLCVVCLLFGGCGLVRPASEVDPIYEGPKAEKLTAAQKEIAKRQAYAEAHVADLINNSRSMRELVIELRDEISRWDDLFHFSEDPNDLRINK
jgi:hypothetical protein